MSAPQHRSATLLLVLAVTFVWLGVPTASAAPVIEQQVVTPSLAWLGDPINITVRCIDADAAVTAVSADIAGPGIVIPGLPFVSQGDGIYLLAVPGSYFDRRGNYTAMVTCTSNESTTASPTFVIAELSGQMSAPNSAFIGDALEVRVQPRRDGEPITSEISFAVTLNDQAVTLSMPPIYDSVKGWVLRLPGIGTSGMHTLRVTVNYQGKLLALQSAIEVRPVTEFSILSLEATSARPGQHFTVSVLAHNRGVPIPLGIENLSIRLNGQTATILGVAVVGSGSDIRVELPTLSPGRYQLSAELRFNASTYSATVPLDMILVLSGTYTTPAGAPLNAQLRFLKGSTEKARFSTLTDGTYSGALLPDTYDIELTFPEATVVMSRAGVASNDQPTYQYRTERVDGLQHSGIYVLGSPWGFDTAQVTLSYPDQLITDETQLMVYRCENWDGTTNQCSGIWSPLRPVVNTAQNRVTFSVSAFTAFVVGAEDRLRISLSTDKRAYAKQDLIKVRGSLSASGGQLANVTVRVFIPGTYVDQTVVTDRNGLFSLEFLGPDTQGSYELQAFAQRQPYTAGSNTVSFDVASLPAASLVFPGTVQRTPGSNGTEELVIVNTGQSDLTGISLVVDLPSRYYQLGAVPSSLAQKQEVRIPIQFQVPVGENATTFAGAVNFSSAELDATKLFGFTVLEAPPQGSVITGKAAADPLPVPIDMSLMIPLAGIAGVAFALAFLLKKVRNRRASVPSLPVPGPSRVTPASWHSHGNQGLARPLPRPIPRSERTMLARPNVQHTPAPASHRQSNAPPGAYLAEVKDYLSNRNMPRRS